MKEINMLVWLTQLGISVAAPLAGFSLLGLWLRSRFGLGIWVMLVCIGLGLVGAVSGLMSSLRMMERMDKTQKKGEKAPPPPTSYNEHE